MIAALLTSALLAPQALAAPGGYRLHAAGAGDQVSLRTAVAVGEVLVFQDVPRIRVGTDTLTADLQLPIVVATDRDGWSEFGLGRTRLGGRIHVGDERRHAFGLEAGVTTIPSSLWVTTWGSHSRETQPGWDAVAFWEFDLPVPIDATLRLGGGLSTERYFPPLVLPFVVEASSFQAIPLGSSWALVFEEEAMLMDHTIASIRGMLRWRAASGASIDLGAQQPLLSTNIAPLLPQGVLQFSAPM